MPGRPRRSEPGPAKPGTPLPDRPLYRLSDYLFEIGRYELRHDCPPAPFWAAALKHAGTDEDRLALARSAYERGRVRVSASVSDGRDLFGLYDRSSSYLLGQEADRARAESALATIGEQRASGELQRNAVLAYFYRRQEAHQAATRQAPTPAPSLSGEPAGAPASNCAARGRGRRPLPQAERGL
ncbi:hypothetical protein OG894_41955 (plasmid) [Streptomyces sp. NBC_01724]|uniref:hypothetical protein n=1 Tax=Streptomyces sp. NBC_01724 TaxID=2975922 RepID=UPI002E31D30B|nr:hypothetical protein [Streptomyces sp. NBC_01724]